MAEEKKELDSQKKGSAEEINEVGGRIRLLDNGQIAFEHKDYKIPHIANEIINVKLRKMSPSAIKAISKYARHAS